MNDALHCLLLIGTLPGILPSALFDASYRWPNGRVPYYFSPNVTLEIRRTILGAMDEIQQKTCIHFQEAVETDEDYLAIFRGSNNGCATPIGRQGGEQAMVLGSKCYHHSVILCELFITLGFVMEHTRPDRDGYIDVKWDHIQESKKKWFEKKFSFEVTLLDTPYDYNSITHFQDNADSKDGSLTIVAKKQNITLGSKGYLTPLDIMKINKYYHGCVQINETNLDTNQKQDKGTKGNTNVNIFLYPLWMVLFLIFVVIFNVSKHKKETIQQKKTLEALYKQLMMETSAPNPTLQNPLDQNVSALPYKKEYEVERGRLMFGDRIGEGQFGHVWAGALLKSHVSGDRSEDRPLAVAIKGPQDGGDPAHHKALSDELKIMCAIGKHPNILALVGAVTKNIINGEFYVITELCANGSLKKFLEHKRSSFIDELRLPEITEQICELDQQQPVVEERLLLSDSLTTSDLICFSMQVAQGMEYLSSLPCIHRDLAARNVLITSNFVCRIADFGLARHENNDYYRQKSDSMVPFKWISMEALEQGLYTVESDVWSYGILLYEIFSLGGAPYPKIGPDELLIKLKDGYRNPKPKYQLMMECWQAEPRKRPTFARCATLLLNHLERSSPQLLNKMQHSVAHDADKQKDLVKWIAQDSKIPSRLPGEISVSTDGHRDYFHLHGNEDKTPEPMCICGSARACLYLWNILVIIISLFQAAEVFMADPHTNDKTPVHRTNKIPRECSINNLGVIELISDIVAICISLFLLIALCGRKRLMLKIAYWIVVASIFFNIFFWILRLRIDPVYLRDTPNIVAVIVYILVFGVLIEGLQAWAIKRIINSMGQNDYSVLSPSTSEYPLLPAQ